MLLLAVRFVTLAQQPLDAPPITASKAPSRVAYEEQEDQRVVVRITPMGFSVTGGSVQQLACRGVCAPETYDYDGLTTELVIAKDRHPDEPRVILVPDPSIPYEVLVRTMDASAIRPDGTPLFPQPLLVTGGGA